MFALPVRGGYAMTFGNNMNKRQHKKENQRGEDSYTRFVSAAIEGNQRRMQKMLCKGFDINSSNEAGETAFSWCCQYNKLRSAQFLYKHGANVNVELLGVSTPLDIAVCWASPHFRSWLILVGGVRKKGFN